MQLSFADQVLLQPEILDNYCASLALAAREEPDGLGVIEERRARNGDFPLDPSHRLNKEDEERLVLVAAVEEVVGRGIAIRLATERGEMLVFPSELRADIPDYPGGYTLSVAFRFEGPVGTIYAALAVSLINSTTFEREQLFKNAALFRSTRSQTCGFAVHYPEEGNDALGELTVFFDEDIDKGLKLIFLRYINQQLERLALRGSVTRRRIYQCECSNYEIPEQAVTLRAKRGEETVVCPVCLRHYKIDDLAEASGDRDELTTAMETRALREQERQTRLVVLGDREQGRFYHVFMCHNSADKPVVRDLANRLREQGILPWVDEEGILAGEQFVPELEEIIDTVPAVAVVIGPHWLGRWQKQEYNAFLQRFVEYRQEGYLKRLRLIPVIVPGAPKDLELPPLLRGFQRIDFRGRGLDDRIEIRSLVNGILAE